MKICWYCDRKELALRLASSTPRIHTVVQTGRHVRRRAFSLVETVLALGVIAVAFVPIFGLLPLGLQSYHQATDSSVKTQIFQRVSNELQQTDFSTLIATTSPPDRFFDYQGNEVTATDAYIYQINTCIEATTGLPAGAAPSSNNPYLATAVIQIANNPGHAALTKQPAANGTPLLWANTNLSVSTFFTAIARNR